MVAIELGLPIHHGASGIAKRLDAIRRHHPLRGQRLLDVGCGNGAYTIELAEGFDEVDAIDVEPERLSELRDAVAGAPSIHVHEMSATALDFPANHFDVVTAIEVIEHVEALDTALAEIARVLRPGGALCLTCPNRLFPLETHWIRVPFTERWITGKVVPFLPYVPPLHARFASAKNFTASELRERLAGYGLREVARDYVMPPFDGWALGRMLVRPITERLERTPLKIFGVSIVGIYVKG